MNIHVQFLKPLQVRNKIRLGNKFDGGYVVYEPVLDQTDILVSYGVGWETTFEEQFNLITNKPAYMFDPTLYNGSIVDTSYSLNLLAKFRGKALFDYLKKCHRWSRHLRKLQSRNIFFIQEGISVISTDRYDKFETHKQKISKSSDQILLKIDIEGGEYDIFTDDSFLASLNNVIQLIVEFHDLKNKLLLLKKIICKLGNEFELVHFHGNNWSELFTIFDFQNESGSFCLPDVAELTFVRKGIIAESDLLEEIDTFSIDRLDYPNNPNREDYTFNF